MRILTPSLALVLGLALAPAAAFAQASNVSVPPPNPKASVTGSMAPSTVGSGANNSVPVGGPWRRQICPQKVSQAGPSQVLRQASRLHEELAGQGADRAAPQDDRHHRLIVPPPLRVLWKHPSGLSWGVLLFRLRKLDREPVFGCACRHPNCLLARDQLRLSNNQGYSHATPSQFRYRYSAALFAAADHRQPRSECWRWLGCSAGHGPRCSRRRRSQRHDRHDRRLFSIPHQRHGRRWHGHCERH